VVAAASPAEAVKAAASVVAPAEAAATPAEKPVAAPAPAAPSTSTTDGQKA
jgi:hypothetical protein